ncbi:MAG TPA: MFS transporter [Rhizobium sp.]
MTSGQSTEKSREQASDMGQGATLGAISLLMALTALGQLATNIVVPSLRDIAAAIRLQPESSGLILSMVLLGLAVGQLIVGPLSDRHGRRPVLLAGLAVYFVGSLAATFAPNGFVLLFGRLMQGMGASAGLALPRAILRDRYKGQHFLHATALLTMSMSVTPGLAPIVGSFVSGHFGWRASLAVSLAAGLATIIATLIGLDETHHNRHSGGFLAVLGSYKKVLGNRIFLAYAIVAGAGIGGAYAEVAVAERFYTGEFAWSSLRLSLATACYAAAFVIGNLLSGHLKSNIRMRIGIILMILAPALLIGLLAVGVTSPWAMLCLIVLSQIGLGFMMAAAISHSLMAVEHASGTASAVLGAIHMLIGASGAALVAAIPLQASWAIPVTMLGFALISALALAIAESP